MMRWLGGCLLLVAGLSLSFGYPSIVVDLSHHNEKADLARARRAGIVAVVHKATQGDRYIDPAYSRRRAEAEAAGLLWGAYHFGVGGIPGQQQAEHFLRTVGNTTNVLLALDMEENRSGRTMSVAEAEDFVITVVDKGRRYPVLYGGPYHLAKSAPHQALKGCPLWISHYTSSPAPKIPSPWTWWALWQYTDGKIGGDPKTVDGIGACDMNRFNGTESQLRENWTKFFFE